MNHMKISVVGTGYVGLVTGACFAELGHDVICVDNDAQKVARMQAGDVPIYEPGLDDVVARATASGRLRFTTELAASAAAKVVFLALPTPPGEDGSADLSYILGVAGKLGPLLRHYTVVVDKSTVPVGTAQKVRARIAKGAKHPFDVVSNPEFLREGFAVRDFMEPDRIVVGTHSAKARAVMAGLYAPIAGDEGCRLLCMDEASAELTKYAANSFLAMKISFMNEIANLCERVGADVDAVRLGVGSDERIGHRFLFPGIGYGGSCFPKDVQALLCTANEQAYDFGLLEAVIKLNNRQQKVLTQKVLRHFGGDVRGKTFALWGLAFKPDTDDIRQSPALGVIEDLTAAGAQVVAYDPEAMDNVRRLMAGNRRLSFADSEYDAAGGADALLVVTEWAQFKSASLARLKKLLAKPEVFDGRNVFEPDDMRRHGFYYESVGRATVRK